ncbi:caspase family protein [Labrys portucalensis]|uniref:Caspase family protein n=1 Tax=Labrys neptuniae TaxID=376174 RepID=A0ABV6ZFX2_9HYPH
MPNLLIRLCLLVWIPLQFGVIAGAHAAMPEAGVCREIPAGRDSGDKRVALVVGNAAYRHGLPALANPANDAAAVARTLSRLGFEVILLTDASDRQLQACLARASARMSQAAIGLFYYSGHGIQVDDENYLVALNARAGNLKTGFVPVQPIVEEIQRRAAATLVFLDACRNNPLAPRGREGLSVSTGRGIQIVASKAPVPKPAAPQARGLMVAYSTSPNSVAVDGDGDLSPFTDAFIRRVLSPGYSIQRVMSEVTNAVGEQTTWAQTPWMKSSLTRELKLDGEQTLAEAQAVSQNWANLSLKLLWTHEGRQAALAAALKGLPAEPSEATLRAFPDAYIAVFSAMHASMSKLPVNGLPLGDINGDQVAVFRLLENGASSLELWSQSRQVLLRPVAEYPANEAHGARFSPDGTLLLSFGNGTVAGWDMATGVKRFLTVVAHEAAGGLLGQRKWVFDVGFSPDGRFFYVTATDKKILQILDARTGNVVEAFDGAAFAPVADVAQSPAVKYIGDDKLLLLLSSSQQPERPVIATYDLKEHQLTLIDRVSAKSVTHLGYDPAGRYVALTLMPDNGFSGQADFMVWDIRSKKKVLSAKGMVMDASFDPTGRFVLASAGTSSTVYDLSDGKETSLAAIPSGFRAMPGYIASSTGLSPVVMPSGPWFSWDLPHGRALVDLAFSTLPGEQQARVAQERVSYVGND